MYKKVVIVTGGRNFSNKNLVWDPLTLANPTLVIQGGASGADKLAKSWARMFGVPCAEVEANWDKYGRGAGPIRNKWMASLFDADLCLAFEGGKGTANMIKAAREEFVKVKEIL